MSKKLLVVVDYQNDFVDGALGFEKATKIAPYIISLVKKYEEEGEDAGETMHVDLSKVNPKITEIVFIVTIYYGDEGGTTFGKVREPFISITNKETGDELCRFDLKDKFSSETAVVAGSLICDENGDWSFEAQGKGYEGGMQTLIDIYA